MQTLSSGDALRIESEKYLADLSAVVKELVDNGIDAGATRLGIVLVDYGRYSVSVTDNGEGMDRDELTKAVQAHYTSKLGSIDEINQYTPDTLGFRGQGLAGICYLSGSVLLRSRKSNNPAHWELRVTEGSLSDPTPIPGDYSGASGTHVLVSEPLIRSSVRSALFRQDAFRRWFVDVVGLLQEIAILNAESLAMTVTHIKDPNHPNGARVLFETPDPPSSPKSMVARLWQLEDAENSLLDLKFEGAGWRADGFVGHPTKPLVRARSRIGYGASQRADELTLSQSSGGRGGRSVMRGRICLFGVNRRPTYFPRRIQRIIDTVFSRFTSHNCACCLLRVIASREVLMDINLSPDKREMILPFEGALSEKLREALEAVLSGAAGIQCIEPGAVSAAKRRCEMQFDDAAVKRPRLTPTSILLSSSPSRDPLRGVPTDPIRRDPAVRDEQIPTAGTIHHTVPGGGGCTTVNLLTFTPHQASAALPLSSQESNNAGSSPSAGNSGPKLKQEVVGKSNARETLSPQAPISAGPGCRITHWGQDPTSPSGETARATTFRPSTEAMMFSSVRTLHFESQTSSSLADLVTVSPPETQPAPPSDWPRSYDSNTAQSNSPGSPSSGSGLLPRLLVSVPNGSQDTSAATANGTPHLSASHAEGQDHDSIENETKSRVKATLPSCQKFKQPGHAESTCGSSRTGGIDQLVECGMSTPINFNQGVDNDQQPQRCREIAAVTEASSGPGTHPNEHISAMDAVSDTCSIPKRSRLRLDIIGLRERLKSLMEQKELMKRSAAARITEQPSSPSKLTTTVQTRQQQVFGNMEVIGNFRKSFIIARAKQEEFGDTGISQSHWDIAMPDIDLYVIDQHAADEKYQFETLNRNLVISSQPLLNPLKLSLSPQQLSVVSAYKNTMLRENGFVVKECGSQQWALCTTPLAQGMPFTLRDFEELLDSLCSNIIEDELDQQESERDAARCHSPSPSKKSPDRMLWGFGRRGVIPRPPRLWNVLAMKACRSAVMFGTAISLDKMTRIIENLKKLNHPWNCPHGRPTTKLLHTVRFQHEEIHAME